MHIEQLKIKNFKALRDVEIRGIPRFCVLVGKNGSGKSTLFSVFGFLREALTSNVQTALGKLSGRKGFAEVRSRDATGNIEIELAFRQHGGGGEADNPLITYSLSIGEEDGRAVVAREVLEYTRGDHGKPWRLLDFQNGAGYAVTSEALESVREADTSDRREETLKARDILAIKGLAQFSKFPTAVALGDAIGRWHLSDIDISKMRGVADETYGKHLSREGENLSSVISYLHKRHPEALAKITARLKRCVPSVSEVTPQKIETGQILLKIKEKAFKEPFLVRDVSDGTVKMLAYLVLLYDPVPHPLLCVEEPESQLYHDMLERLAEEFRLYAYRGEQVFVSTHSPHFLAAAKVGEVFCIAKREDGYSTIVRADSDEQVAAHMKDGSRMSYLWARGHLANMLENERVGVPS